MNAMQVEPLNEALERMRLEGVIFMRTEYTEGWALKDLGGPMFAAMMHPGADRLVLSMSSRPDAAGSRAPTASVIGPTPAT